MSYRIDGETPYWGVLEFPCKERECPDAWDLVFKEMTRTLEESRKACKEWEDTMNKLTEKLEQMEKKTKKMTKAEAFEWLKGKKVNTKGRGEKVQTKLFECGFSWVNGQCRYYDFSDYLLFETEGKLWHCGNCGESYWRSHHFEEISVDDILSIEIVEEECAKDDEDPYFGGRIKDLQEMLEDDEVLIITKTNFLTMTK